MNDLASAHTRQLKHLFTDPTGLVPVVTGLITTGHSHFPADPTGRVPVVNRFDHYINGRLTAPVCSFKTLLPPAQGRWGAFLLGDALHSSQTLLPPAQGRWGVLHANIYIIGVSPSLDYPLYLVLWLWVSGLQGDVVVPYRVKDNGIL